MAYNEVCNFVDELTASLIQKDKCFYQKLLILGFGGVKFGGANVTILFTDA